MNRPEENWLNHTDTIFDNAGTISPSDVNKANFANVTDFETVIVSVGFNFPSESILPLSLGEISFN
jgi:hypothetical protein